MPKQIKVSVYLSVGEKARWLEFAKNDGHDTISGWIKQQIRLQLRGRRNGHDSAAAKAKVPPPPNWTTQQGG